MLFSKSQLECLKQKVAMVLVSMQVFKKNEARPLFPSG